MFTDWQEFRDQARRDLLSCKTLRKENDFGNAAYLLQQSLEKYVKAYLFKYKVFSGDPRDLGHFPLKTLFKNMSDETDRKIRLSKNSQTKDILNKFAPTAKEMIKLFEKIKDRNKPIWRKAIWKDSLGIKLNDEEKAIIEQTRSDYETRLVPELIEAGALFSTGVDRFKKMLQDPTKKRLIEETLKNKTGLSSDKALDFLRAISADVKQVPNNAPNSLDLLENMIRSGQADPKYQEQVEFTKLLQGSWIFIFRNEIIQTFTHQDIGRYPTDIDGTSSRAIYAERVQDLDKLIERVENSCKKIEEMLEF